MIDAAEPPHAPEAEVAVLGGMLIDPEAAAAALGRLEPADFHDSGRRVVYRAMGRLAARGVTIDPVTVAEELRAAGELEAAGGLPQLAELLAAVPTAANLGHHVRIVRDRALLRRLAEAGNLLRAEAQAGGDPAAVLGRAVSLLRHLQEEGYRDAGRALPAPLGVAELLTQPEPEERWIAEGLIPTDANVLLAGSPKTHKTNFLLELAVAGASGTDLLGRFGVPERRRMGLVLMEDRPHRVRRRLERICLAHGCELPDLDGYLYVWFRPALRLAERAGMQELGRSVEEYGLDFVAVDNWSLVASGDSDDADSVTPQLAALADLRARAPGLTVALVHHARKSYPGQGQDRGGERLSDVIRNSSAFGAWFDAGLVLSRADETAPIKVRAELRDLPAPEPFGFMVEDQYPAGPDTGLQPSGWLRLVATTTPPALLERRAQALRFRPAVLEFLGRHPGASKRQLRAAIAGDNALIDAALDLLIEEGLARYEAPPTRGAAGRCWPTALDRAETALPAHPGDRADRAAPPVGGARQHTLAPAGGDRAGPASHPCGDPLRLLEEEDG